MIASILGLTLYVLAIVLILDLSPRRVTEDLLQIITPHQTLHERIKAKATDRAGSRNRLSMRMDRKMPAANSTSEAKQIKVNCLCLPVDSRACFMAISL